MSEPQANGCQSKSMSTNSQLTLRGITRPVPLT